MVGDHGLDTVMFGWQDARAVEEVRELARQQPRDLATGRRQGGDWKGGFMRLRLPVAGMTVGVYPGRGLVIVEARLASMLAGHDRDDRLIDASRLRDGARRGEMAVDALGITLDAPVTVRRIDLAAELCFTDSAEGLAFLNACARLHLPRLRQVLYHATGEARLESIVWQTLKGKRTHIKLYDAGFQHQTHSPGLRLRLERELRWNGSAAPTPEQVALVDLAGLYVGRMQPWLRAAGETRVAAPRDAVTEVYAAARRGEMMIRRADSLVMKINSLAYADDLLEPRTRRRRTSDLRDAGIVVDRSGDPQARAIDLGAALAALAATWDTTEDPMRPTGSAG